MYSNVLLIFYLNCFCSWNKQRKTTTCSIHTWKILQWQICFVRLVGFVKIATDGALLVSHCCCHLASRSTLWQPVCLLARALCSNELTRHVGLPLFCAFACGAVGGVSFALVRINNGRLTKVMTFSLNHHNVLHSSNCDLISYCIDGIDIAIATHFLATGIVSQFFSWSNAIKFNKCFYSLNWFCLLFRTSTTVNPRVYNPLFQRIMQILSDDCHMHCNLMLWHSSNCSGCIGIAVVPGKLPNSSLLSCWYQFLCSHSSVFESAAFFVLSTSVRLSPSSLVPFSCAFLLFCLTNFKCTDQESHEAIPQWEGDLWSPLLHFTDDRTIKRLVHQLEARGHLHLFSVYFRNFQINFRIF